MNNLPHIAAIFGTRPEAIKMAPVVRALQARSEIRTTVCVTGQHRQMLDQILQTFEISPDHDLDVMEPGQSLAGLTARAMTRLDAFYREQKPDLVLVQGDTTTAFVATLAAFYHKIPVGHVEAGLRTGNLFSPWPEEANRQLISRLAKLHFPPTEVTEQNLLREGADAATIHRVGNTVIDALLYTVKQVESSPPPIPNLPTAVLEPGTRFVLITGHRRENFGDSFESICQAIADLARKFPEVWFVYPVHLNPNVRQPVDQILRPAELKNVVLLDPLAYREFVTLFRLATVLLSDSGGVQEEAPSLGKPLLVMRDSTERPEAVETGVVKLVGANRERIVSEVSRLLSDPEAYAAMSRVAYPYGDGKASERIAEVCVQFLGKRCE
jgi:UDP-N-acetylglucosamine 2-epimerase (non-hydrolysing)